MNVKGTLSSKRHNIGTPLRVVETVPKCINKSLPRFNSLISDTEGGSDDLSNYNYPRSVVIYPMKGVALWLRAPHS